MKFIVGLLFSLSMFGQAAEPEVKVYTFYMDARGCATMANITPFAKNCQENVMVIATTTDATVTAFKITIDFVDKNGQDQHREGLTPFEYGGGATYWFTGPLMEGIIIRKVTAQPLKIGGAAVTQYH